MSLSANVQCPKVGTVLFLKPFCYNIYLNGNYSFTMFTLLLIYLSVAFGFAFFSSVIFLTLIQFVVIRIPRFFSKVMLQRQWVPILYLCIPFLFFYVKHFAFVCATLLLLISSHLSNLAQTFWILILSYKYLWGMKPSINFTNHF